MIGILSDGHILLEGVPGLAKTLTVKSVAQAIKASFQRIQFTPDLLPADIVGTLIYNQKTGEFTPKRGPIFANFILGDEINRSPAKVQSALLEGMQEHQVTIGDQSHTLPDPFLVLATQNPIEQEGTYPLPEAQIDRFMLKVLIDYPPKEDERDIMDHVSMGTLPQPQPVVTTKEIARLKSVVRGVYVDDKIKQYILSITEASRRPDQHNLKKIAHYINYGISPRGTTYLLMAAKAHAFLAHKSFVSPEDIKAIGPDVLRHRLLLSFEAEADEVTPDALIKTIFDTIEVP